MAKIKPVIDLNKYSKAALVEVFSLLQPAMLGMCPERLKELLESADQTIRMKNDLAEVDRLAARLQVLSKRESWGPKTAREATEKTRRLERVRARLARDMRAVQARQARDGGA